MFLEVPIIREVQIISPRALGIILDSPNIRPTTTETTPTKDSKRKAQPGAYPGRTPALYALNVKVMIRGEVFPKQTQSSFLG